jgi:F-type H+-transporting ATPase subunit a
LLNNFRYVFSSLLIVLNKEIKIIVRNYHRYRLFISLFFIILLLNLIGLLPFVFPATSHLRLTLVLSLPLWLRLFFCSVENLNKFFAHLVPYGCPFRLIFLIVLIESIRTVIRPLTLAIRLRANIIAGHIIIILIRIRSYTNLIRFNLRLITELVISLLELGVALIQPYVFFILLTLYRAEI